MITKVSQAVRRHLACFIFGPALKMVEAIFDLLIPLFMKTIIDLSFHTQTSVITQGIGNFLKLFGTWIPDNANLNYAIIGGVCILVMGILGFATTMVTQYLAAKTAVAVGTDVRDSLYQKILSLSQKDLEIYSLSRLLTVLNADSYQVQQGVLFFIRLAVRAPFIILGSLIISFLLDWQIGLVFLALTPLLILIIIFIMTRASRKYLAIQSQLDGLSNQASDDLDGSKVVRAFNRTDYENQRFEKASKEYQDASIDVGKLNSLINPLTFALVSLATLAVVLLGGLSMNATSAVQPSTIITEVAYLDQIFQTTVLLTNLILIFTKSAVSIHRVNDVLAIQPSVKECRKPQRITLAPGDEILRFDHVDARYAKEGNLALTDIDFRLAKGQSLGIIGGTGSGKSTVIKLMERFLDPVDGKVWYKGVDLKDYSLKGLREEIGYVPQKSVLFKGTIRSNMLLANPKLTDSEIHHMLAMAMAEDFVSALPSGLDNPVEESGKNFSGGQRQRLCIARALGKSPEVLILDDSTSALDLLTDKAVRDNLSRDYPGLTKVIVSQRIATISHCDLILVLEGGKILAQGKHDELLNSCPAYKETFESQTQREA
ncbi:MAG: ABC transporter ATP-binding protein/permease [Bacilli bacterium]|jgi:ATP-binding cassette subfamily B multidrug efflux pump|nr:ABC transporter ATP-binding protein/permease [Bacilli bacterium]